jgi:acetolactate synthase I/II/III large subunit
MRAAEVIVASLKSHGVERVYCVPGESYLALLDGFHDSGIDVIVCRHEGGAAFMAAAEAKLTGKPTVCAVSRGPGATNASIGMHMAEQDALPVILLVGQVAREERMRGVFQEMDYGHFFGNVAKGVFEITDGARLADVLPRVFRLACEGVPGPVVVSLPEDLLRDEVPDQLPVVFPAVHAHHNAKDVARILDMIGRSERPLVMAGSCFRGSQGAVALQRFADGLRVPVATTWKNQDVFDNASPLFAGHMGFGAPKPHQDLLRDADLVIAAGTRLGDVASFHFTLPAAPQPQQTVIHIYPDGKPIGKNVSTELGLIADPVALFAELAQNPRVVSSAREAWVSRIHGFMKSFMVHEPFDPPDGVDFGEVVTALERHAPKDAILCTDSGNGPTWMHRHWHMSPRNVLLGSIAGSMGFGVPAATVAALLHPERTAICFVGDGGILMTGNEIATALAYGAKPKIVLSDNSSYGTIRLHQERDFPGRVSGTTLINPDFVAWAKSFGVAAFRLERGDDIDAAVKSFLAEPGAALLHVKSSQIALSANARMKV